MAAAPKQTLVGIISDTHGLLREEALTALAGSSLIVHAGDVGRAEVLRGLEAIAPVYAIRGNVDTGLKLPERRTVDAAGVKLYVIHDLKQFKLNPGARGLAAVIFGHSHVPGQTLRDGVLYLNPGSAGPRRFRLPVTVARMRIADGKLEPEIVEIA